MAVAGVNYGMMMSPGTAVPGRSSNLDNLKPNKQVTYSGKINTGVP
jgi:hypothetical protein